MPKLITFLNFFVAFFILLQVPKTVLSFSSFTFKDYTLPSYPYHGITTRDWMACVLACVHEGKCLSYNFEYDKENGQCDLFNCGLDERFELAKQLVFSRGLVFQQVKEAKVFIFYFVSFAV